MLMLWDEVKRGRNLLPEPDGHGLDFADARDRFEWSTALVLSTYPGRHGGERRVAIGFLDGDLVTLVFAPLGRKPSPLAFGPRATRNGDAMSKDRKPVAMLSDEEEASLQKQIASDPDNPELTDDELAAMRPASEVLAPELYANLTRPRGRPKADIVKTPIKLRIDPRTLARFKAEGPGWQTRMGILLAQNDLVLKMIRENVELIDSMESVLSYMRKGELRMVFEPIETTIARVECNIRNVSETTNGLRDQLVVK